MSSSALDTPDVLEAAEMRLVSSSPTPVPACGSNSVKSTICDVSLLERTNTTGSDERDSTCAAHSVLSVGSIVEVRRPSKFSQLSLKAVTKPAATTTGEDTTQSPYGTHLLRPVNTNSDSTQANPVVVHVDVSQKRNSFGQHLLKRTKSELILEGTIASFVVPIAGSESLHDRTTENSAVSSGKALRRSMSVDDSEEFSHASQLATALGQLQVSLPPKSESIHSLNLISAGGDSAGRGHSSLKRWLSAGSSVNFDLASFKQPLTCLKHINRTEIADADKADTAECLPQYDLQKLRRASLAENRTLSDVTELETVSSFGQHLLKKAILGDECITGSAPHSPRLSNGKGFGPGLEIADTVGFDTHLRPSTSYSLNRLKSLVGETEAETGTTVLFGYLHRDVIKAGHDQPPQNHRVSNTIGSQPVVEDEEARAFSIHINHILRNVESVSSHLPLTGNGIYTNNDDGLIIISLLNIANPDAVNMTKVNIRPKNIYQKVENLNLALKAAQKIGCHIVNIGTQDIIDGRCDPNLTVYYG
jgi:hypothetical protein